ARHQRAKRPIDERPVELVLAGEIIVDIGLADIRRFGDLVHARAFVAVADEHLFGRVENALPCPLSGAAPKPASDRHDANLSPMGPGTGPRNAHILAGDTSGAPIPSAAHALPARAARARPAIASTPRSRVQRAASSASSVGPGSAIRPNSAC